MRSLRYYILGVIQLLTNICPSRLLLVIGDWRFVRVEVRIKTEDIIGLIPSSSVSSIQKRGFVVENIEHFIPINEYQLHPTIRDIYISNKHYKDTEQFKRMAKAVDSFQNAKVRVPSECGAYWCKTRSDIKKYFEDLDRTYNGICEKGVLLQRQLTVDGSALVKGAGNDDLKFILMPNGKYVFVADGGNHRFGIIKFLRLENINVRLFGVHNDLVKSSVLKFNHFGSRGIVTGVLDRSSHKWIT